MKRMHKCIILLLAFLLTTSGVFYTAFADDDDHREKRQHRKRERKHSEHNDGGNLAAVNNTVYQDNCGACHFAYQPELLPSASWDKILSNPEDHFGEVIDLDPDSKNTIVKYLKENAADHSSSKLSAKIMKCIGDQIPQRISEIPYIQKNHREISQDMLKRKSIGSLSNCTACHTTAEKGIYDDDNVKIPQ